MSIDKIRIALEQELPIKCAPNVLRPIEAQRLILEAGLRRLPTHRSETSGK